MYTQNLHMALPLVFCSLFQYSTFTEFTGFFAVIFAVCCQINTQRVGAFPSFDLSERVILPFCAPSTRTQEIFLVTQH